MYSEDFEKAATWACSQLTDTEHAQVMEAWENRRPIPYAIQGKLSDLMEEYGEDNDLCEGWWLAEADIEDVYLTGTDEQ